MKRLALMVGFALLWGTTTLCAASENLLKNPSFEDDRRHWGFLEPGEVVDGSAHAETGDKCLKITVQGGKYRIAQEVRGILPGEELTFSCWMKTNALQGNGKATVVAKFWIDPKANRFKAYFIPDKAEKGTTEWREYVDTTSTAGCRSSVSCTAARAGTSTSTICGSNAAT